MKWSEQRPTPVSSDSIHFEYEAAAETIAPQLRKPQRELLALIMQTTPSEARSSDMRRRVIKGSTALAIEANKSTEGRLGFDPDDIDLMAIEKRGHSSDVQHFVLPSGEASID